VNVLVDTPVWSLALRRRFPLPEPENRLRRDLTELIEEGRARLIGPIRQELLSGIREEDQYVHLRNHLRAFADEMLQPEDYEEAAHIGNQCRRAGIAGSAADFLLCAVAGRRQWAIFTTDRDFRRYASVFPIELYEIGQR